MKEAARVYARSLQMKGRSTCSMWEADGGPIMTARRPPFISANIQTAEFANDVIYTIKLVCDDENVPHPTLFRNPVAFFTLPRDFGYERPGRDRTVVEDITPSRSTTTIRSSDD